MLAVGFWSCAYALQLAAASLQGQIFWNKVQIMPIAAAPVLWLLLALQYSGRDRRLGARAILLFLVPLVTTILAWTNEFHGLMWENFQLKDAGSFLVESSIRGLWMRIHIAYSYLVIFIGSLLIFERLVASKAQPYRSQAALLLFFALAPWAGNILFILGINPFPHLNLTPFIFIITCPALAWGLFRFQLADLVPVAYAAIIEGMNDGVIVLDEQKRIVEINPAAQEFLGLKPARPIGLPLEQAASDFARQLGLSDSSVSLEQEIVLDGSHGRRIYGIHLSTLVDHRERLISRIIVMRDISDRKIVETELQHHKDHLEEKVERRTSELSHMNEQLVNQITQRERIEKALRESEQKYKGIVENSADIIMLTAPDGVVWYLSPSCKTILEYEPEELVGTEPWIIYPEDSAMVRDRFHRALLGESGSNFEYRVITKSGAVKWVSHSWSPIMDAGRLQMVVSSVRDITEQKTFDEALRRSEERYRMLVDNSLSSIFVNQGGILRFVNKRMVERSEYPEEELVNSPFEKLVHPDDRELVSRIVQSRLSGRNVSGHYEFRGVTRTGKVRWLESFGTKIDYQGADALLVHLNDITDRKKAEEALRESEQRYRSLIEEAKDIIYTIDLETKTISGANSFAEEIFGYKRENIIGSHYLTMVAPEDRDTLAEALASRMQGNERHPNFPFRMRRADGSLFDVEQNGTILFDEEGKPITYLGVARDVTERKRMEEELRRSEERYRQILNSSNDIIVVVGADERVLFANAAYHSHIGHPNDSNIFASVYSEDRDLVVHWFNKALAGESAQNAQFRIIDRNGQTRWLETNADSIQWPGVERAVVSVARDITDRKLAEDALKESEERYRTLVDSSLTGVYVLQDGRFQFVNDMICKMAGYSRDEFDGMKYVDIIHPEDRGAIVAVVEERLTGGSVSGQSQFRCVDKHGRVRWAETHGTKIQFRGKPALLVNLLDITERKHIEQALRDSEQKFRSLVEITSDWVWETDIHGAFTYASPKVKDLLGYEPEDVMGRSAFDLMTSEDARQTRQYVQERAVNKAPFAGVENENLHKNGRIVVLESSGVPYFDANGNLLGYRGIDRDITDRKRADEALRVSEERYRSIFEEAPDLFYMVDLDTWMITDANKCALKVMGYGPEAIGKTSVFSIIHPNDYERAEARITDMITREERMSDLPLRILTSTGDLRHIEQRGVLLHENGKPKYLLGLAHDVTERKLQEEMILRRNEKLAALYEVAKAATASLDLSVMFKLVIDVVKKVTRSDAACIYRYNEEEQTLTYEAFVGLSDEFVRQTDHMKVGKGVHGHVVLSKSPLIAHNLPESVPPEGHPQVSHTGMDSLLIVPLMAREKVIGALTVARRPGRPFDSEDLDLMTAIANQIVGAMDNADLYLQMERSKVHLQSILETSVDGIVVTTEDRRVVYRNTALSTMFGYSESDDLSNTETDTYFAPESLPVLVWMREKMEKNEPPLGMIEFKGKRKDGSSFDAEMRLGFFLEQGKRLDVGVVRDITERKRMEFQLLQSGKLAAIGELAAGVAHEINNPISAIDVQTGLMRDILADECGLDGPFVSQFHRCLDVVEGQVRRCHSVTNNLLSFSRFPESGKERFDVNQLLRKTIQFVTSLSDKNPKIELRLDERVPLLYADPNRLEQVFVNLWNNAVRAIDREGSVLISTGMDEQNNIKISFTDSGAGIPMEIRDRIFEPFFTTRPEGEGTGLGLSISYYIIREMKGNITFESSCGNGTTFTIALPGTKNDAREELPHAS
jgi:PAS domain S-box-containing protein